MKKDLISVILPFLNGEKYIDKALNSLFEQTYNNYEIILIDNGSTDNSKDKIKKYDDKRIKYYCLDEANVSNARNFGISKSNGEFIYFMDIDDTIENNSFEILIRKIKDKNVDLVIFNYYEVYKDKKIENALPWNDCILDDDKINNMLIPNMLYVEGKEKIIMGSVWRIFTYSKFIKKILFNINIKIAEDLLYCISLFSCIDNMYVLNCPLYNYTISTSSSLNKPKLGMINKSIEFNEILKKTLINNGLFDNNIIRDRYYKRLGKSYTTSISSAVRHSNRKVAIKEIKNIVKKYKEDKEKYLNYDYPFYIKLSFFLMKFNMYNLIYIVYKYKERKRTKNFN